MEIQDWKNIYEDFLEGKTDTINIDIVIPPIEEIIEELKRRNKLKFEDIKFGNEYLESHKHDISAEEYRVYYEDSVEYARIDNPVALAIAETGNHRVVDEDGVCFRVPMLPTTVIEWKNRRGVHANF